MKKTFGVQGDCKGGGLLGQGLALTGNKSLAAERPGRGQLLRRCLIQTLLTQASWEWQLWVDAPWDSCGLEVLGPKHPVLSLPQGLLPGFPVYPEMIFACYLEDKTRQGGQVGMNLGKFSNLSLQMQTKYPV